MKKLLLLAFIIIPTIFNGTENKNIKSYVVYNIEDLKEIDAYGAVVQLPGPYATVTQVIKKKSSKEIGYKKTTRLGETIELDETAVQAGITRLNLHEKSLALRKIVKLRKKRRI